jgi:hypothetical protein
MTNMTNEEAKAILNMLAGVTIMSAMSDPSNEALAKTSQKTIEAVKIACDAIDIVSERLELEHDEDKGDN